MSTRLCSRLGLIVATLLLPTAVLANNAGEAVVLEWRFHRADLPISEDVSQLVIRADGVVHVADPHGFGKAATASLEPAALRALLAAVTDEGLFAIAENDVRRQIRAEKLRLGIAPDGVRAGATTIRIRADGREHAVRCDDLDPFHIPGESSGKLAGIQARLRGIVNWTYAGGDAGIAAAVARANAQLARDFPAAPALRAEDLEAALQQPNGDAWVSFERRHVAADKNPYSFVHARVTQAAGTTDVAVRAHLADVSNDYRGMPVTGSDSVKIEPADVRDDQAVRFDYPIVYIRASRIDEARQDSARNYWPNVDPVTAPPKSELMLLMPDGKQEVLVAAGDEEALIDPVVSFDGQWVYYVKFHNAGRDMSPADIYKVHVPTRKVVQLTRQEATPNTPDSAKQIIVQNTGPCPLPGGEVMFTSNRNGYIAVAAGGGGQFPRFARQLFVMDDDGGNVQLVGQLNLGDALHPTVLKDGRVMFSSRETQGLRQSYVNAWGIWTIHPDGTNWNPLLSSFVTEPFHFQTQLSDGSIVVELYYPGQTTKGFGTYYKFPLAASGEAPVMGPARREHPANTVGRKGAIGQRKLPFAPRGIEVFTAFATFSDRYPSFGWGNLTHPAAAPDNHMLTVWGGSSNIRRNLTGAKAGDPSFDSGIYLIKDGRSVNHPEEMRRVINDPAYHEMWPRALVPYERIHGVREPARLPVIDSTSRLSKHLPEGTPAGLVGTSSMYKRESYPEGEVPKGSVTAEYTGAFAPFSNKPDPYKQLGGVFQMNSANWLNQGAEAAIYSNSEIHAIRIVATEPISATRPGFFSHASRNDEKLRVLGEIPVRKFQGGKQPNDPDGNPDTSFLAKIPGDVAWTFQTLDKNGMVLNMAQTWHQVRPGEVRNNCGGCHAHSQKPTDFNLTFAAKDDYKVWDLMHRAPLLTDKQRDETGKQWDTANETGVRYADGPLTVEYHRDIKPILQKSCVACHTKASPEPAGNLVLDDDDNTIEGLPGTYFRLARDNGQPSGQGWKIRYGHMPVGFTSYARIQASRYIRQMQSRRSLLAWKIHGHRLDGFTNDDHPSPKEPGGTELFHKGEKIDTSDAKNKKLIESADIDFHGSIMPPPEAVAGTYKARDGKPIKVAPLTDEDKRMLVRWIDLGCPVDLTSQNGMQLDESRPTLALAYPAAGAGDKPLERILLGLHDYGTGLDAASLTITADFPIDGIPVGQNLAPQFKPLADDRWEMALKQPIRELAKGTLVISVKDRRGNTTSLRRTFSVTNPQSVAAGK